MRNENGVDVIFDGAIVVLSKTNVEFKDANKLEEINKAFPDFVFENKEIDGNDKSPCSIMIKHDIKYERMKQYEDNINSSVAIRIKDGSNKWVSIMGIY